MHGIKKTAIKYEMKKYCKSTPKAIDLMQSVVIDFIKESCTRANIKLHEKKKVIVTEKILSDAIGLK